MLVIVEIVLFKIDEIVILSIPFLSPQFWQNFPACSYPHEIHFTLIEVLCQYIC